MVKENISALRSIRMLLIITCVLLVLIFGSVLAIWYDMEYGFNPPKHPDFQGYTTDARIGEGVLTGKSLVRVKEPGLAIWNFSYILAYDNNVKVYQRSTSGRAYYDWRGTCKGVAPSSGDYSRSCQEKLLAIGGRLAVKHDAYRNEIFSVSVEAVIGNTIINVTIPKDKIKEYIEYDWEGYFNTLKPVDLRDVPLDK